MRPERERLEDRLAPAVGGWSSAGAAAAVPALISSASNSTTTAPTPSPSVPVGAQYAVSESLGKDDPAYAAAASGDGYAVSNATNQYSAFLDASGLHVATGSDAWSLTVQGVGYGGSLQTLGTATSTSTANRVEYDYGGVSQWFVNGPLGLQQGFTLAQRPAGGTSGAPLTVGLALGGDLTATADAGGTSVTLARADGSSALSYGGLIAYDATGRAIPAHMSVVTTADGQSLSIQVDDAGAQYPLTIDPFVQQAKLTGDEVDVSLFGYAVGMNGDGTELIIGSKGVNIGFNNGQGVAYVFTRTGTSWSQTARLTASDGAAGDSLGFAVALSLDGATAVVGAPNAAIGNNTHQGAVYVYSRSGSSWTQTQKVSASDGAAEAFFGSAVSTSGDGAVFVVGVPNATVGGNAKQGAGYVFDKGGALWSQASKITVGDGAANALLGYSVSISGDAVTVALGAPGATIGGKSGQGAVYLFNGSGATWSQAAKLVASDGAAGAAFGTSVSASYNGGVVLSGAPNATIGANANQGAAYVYTRSGSLWPQTNKLTASDGAAADNFGIAVALSGDGGTAVVGAPYAKIGANANQGAVYVYTKSGALWPQTIKLTASDGAAADLFGSPVAVSADGGALLVGVPSAPVGTHFFQGAAYVYYNAAAVTVTSNPVNQTTSVGSTVTFTAAANGSPLPSVQWQVSVDGGANWVNIAGAVQDWFTYAPNLADSGDKFRAVFTNNVGSTVATTAATLTVVKQSTVLTITSNVNPRGVGDTLNLTVHAAAANGVGTPNGGTVNLNIGAVNLSGTLVNGLAVFSSIPVLAVGTYTATATYGGSGDPTFGPAAATLSQVVVRGTTFLNGVVPAQATAGQAVAMKGVVTYTGTTSPPVGGVVFMDNGQPIGFSQLATAAGATAATFTTSTLAVGDHYIQLVYLGEAGTFPSATGVYHLVVAAAGASSVANSIPAPVMDGTAPNSGVGTIGDDHSSASASSLGGPVTNAASGGSAQSAVTITSSPVSQTTTIGSTATFTSSATGSPQLSVQWQVSVDGGANWADVAGATQDWLTITPALADSGNQYRALFTNNIGSTVPTLVATLTVVKQSTVLTITSNVNPRGVGDTLNLTVHAAAANGVGTPNGGTVNLNIGAVNLSGTLVNGLAVFSSIPVLAVGTYTATATYGGSGDPTFGPAAATLSQVVVRGTTFLNGVVPAQATAGQAVAMKGVVTYTGTTSPPVGGVMFMDNGQPIGFSQLATAAGATAATFTTSTLAVGDHYIQLVYLGEAGTFPSATGVYHLVVAAAANSNSLIAAGAPAASSVSSSVAAASASAAVEVGASPRSLASATQSKTVAVQPKVAARPSASAARVLQQRLSVAYKTR
ncbi:beta strand repeat-containing protein [Paludisphaera borealis]|uniref:beta strand repeat-containing protein n=1 Tax=Paludisphaera borealis TaxID=1387353 RepID=UPI0009712B0D|nr:Ig-like domain repeat protein [Paludisphaera borealis]